jgi:hypothetical protein
MIALQRDRTAIPARFRGQRRKTELTKLFSAILDGSIKTRAVKDTILKSGKWSDAKAQLAADTHGKCAFCESPTTATNYGDVEHYRPKSKFPWFAYCYENFLLSCTLCNGTKGNQHVAGNAFADPVPPWPDAHMPSPAEMLAFAMSLDPDPTDPAAVAAYIQACLDEEIHLPNPYYEDPESLFAWEADDFLQEVRVVAADNSVRSARAMAAAEAIVALKVKAVGQFLASGDPVLVCTHATFRFAVDALGVEAFDDRLIAVDEFHHVSANPDNKLGAQLAAFIARDKTHIVAMTGSYFRGDAAPVLTPDDEAKFETVTYTYYEQLNGYEHLKALDIGYFFYTGRYLEAIEHCLDPSRKTIVHIPNVNARESTKDKVTEVNEILHYLGKWQGADPVTGFELVALPDGRTLNVADLVGRSANLRSRNRICSRHVQ